MIVTGKTHIAGIMGWPVDHSRSPQLHGYWLEKYGIDGVVVPLAVAPERLSEAVNGLAALGFRGSNVTIPHKEAVLPMMDRTTPVAERIGAVNTIIVEADGALLGTNTDAFGFVEHLRASAPNWRGDGATAVVFGAGGAARAVVAALMEENVPEIRLINRTHRHAEAVARHLQARQVAVVDWSMRADAIKGADLVVNATSLGMNGKPPLDVDLQGLRPGAIVYDLVYAPLRTPFLRRAEDNGAVTIDGLGMLLHQARPAFQAWFGQDPVVDERLRDRLIKDLELGS